MLDQFVGLINDLGHVGDVPVPNIRAKDCIEPHTERQPSRIERPRISRIVCFAAKEEVGHVEVADVLLLANPATRVLVERRRILTAVSRDSRAFDRLFKPPVPHYAAAVTFAQAREKFAIETRRIVLISGSFPTPAYRA